jgi:hypothetical protein
MPMGHMRKADFDRLQDGCPGPALLAVVDEAERHLQLPSEEAFCLASAIGALVAEHKYEAAQRAAIKPIRDLHDDTARNIAAAAEIALRTYAEQKRLDPVDLSEVLERVLDLRNLGSCNPSFDPLFRYGVCAETVRWATGRAPSIECRILGGPHDYSPFTADPLEVFSHCTTAELHDLDARAYAYTENRLALLQLYKTRFRKNLINSNRTRGTPPHVEDQEFVYKIFDAYELWTEKKAHDTNVDLIVFLECGGSTIFLDHPWYIILVFIRGIEIT